MTGTSRRSNYHHGDLRNAALTEVARVISDQGIGAVSLRKLAASLGVTHTALSHVFVSRAGLLAALAAQGFRELGLRLREAASQSFLDVGLAYVQFGVDRPAHFAVMYEPTLVEPTEEFLEARDRTWKMLTAGAGEVSAGSASADRAAAVIAAWSMMHGLVTLHLNGMLSGERIAALFEGADIVEIARRSGAMLFSAEQNDE